MTDTTTKKRITDNPRSERPSDAKLARLLVLASVLAGVPASERIKAVHLALCDTEEYGDTKFFLYYKSSIHASVEMIYWHAENDSLNRYSFDKRIPKWVSLAVKYPRLFKLIADVVVAENDEARARLTAFKIAL